MHFLYRNVKNFAAKYHQERASIGASIRNVFSLHLCFESFISADKISSYPSL